MFSFAFVESFGAGRRVGGSLTQLSRDRHFVNLFSQELLYVVETALVIKADEGDGAALGAGAGGSAYAVDVVLGVVGDVKVDYKVYVIYVYSA